MRIYLELGSVLWSQPVERLRQEAALGNLGRLCLNKDCSVVDSLPST